MQETYINPGNWWHHSWIPQPEGLPYGKEEVGEWDRDWGKQQEWSQLEEIIPKEKKSSLEKKESGTSVWLMQGLPIEPVLEAEVQSNFFYSLVLDWTESFSQSQCLGRAAQRRPGKRDCWTYLRIGGWV